MSQHFYRAFEDRYRGAREVIKARLGAYRPFLEALAASQSTPPRALDLGCGRGEWLELLAEAGLAGSGVDLDEGMLQACRERRLDVRRDDALGSLRALPDASLALVSAFHLVEHLPFDMVRDIIAEAQRVLQPGGLLILETPNPENLTVGASSFYLDPSHERPIPPPLLDFAVGFGGFERRRVLRLQEDPQLHGAAPLVLMSVLEGVSPDYAVVAQKAGPAALLARFDAPFEAPRGLTLADLANRYEDQLRQGDGELHRLLEHHAEELHALHAAHAVVAADLAGQHALNQQLSEHNNVLDAQLAAQISELGRIDATQAGQHAQLGRVDAALAALRDDAVALRDDAVALREGAVARAETLAAEAALAALRQQELQAAVQASLAQQAERLNEQAERLARLDARGAQQDQRIIDLLDSTSWRVTAPLRWTGGLARGVAGAARPSRVRRALAHRAKPGVLRLVRAVLRRPRLKRALRGLLARFPGIEARLRRLAYQAPAAMPEAAPPPAPPSEAQLSPRARHAHQQLQRALAARKH